jgi:hypothetical protein
LRAALGRQACPIEANKLVDCLLSENYGKQEIVIFAVMRSPEGPHTLVAIIGVAHLDVTLALERAWGHLLRIDPFRESVDVLFKLSFIDFRLFRTTAFLLTFFEAIVVAFSIALFVALLVRNLFIDWLSCCLEFPFFFVDEILPLSFIVCRMNLLMPLAIAFVIDRDFLLELDSEILQPDPLPNVWAILSLLGVELNPISFVFNRIVPFLTCQINIVAAFMSLTILVIDL